MLVGMNAPKFPLGMLKAVGLWFVDVFMAPSRLKRVAAATEAEADQRAKCLNCASGRVTDLQDAGGYNSLAKGTCDTCGTRWYVNPDTRAVHSVTS